MHGLLLAFLVSVYVGPGARSTGVYRWIELTTLSPQMTTRVVDDEMIRQGVLKDTDILVVPGGRSVQMAKELGEEGRSAIRDFVANGGGYIGTCAGSCLVMEPASHHPDMIHLLPYRSLGARGHADLMVAFNENAKRFGITAKRERIRYAVGPVFEPSESVEGADVVTIATYDSNIESQSTKARETMVGKPAAVAGTYKKGRIVVFTVHPEYDPDDHQMLKEAFGYLSGTTNVTWTLPTRKRGQLSVGFITDNTWGVETAELVQRLVREQKFDVVPVNLEAVGARTLNHLDALIAPDGCNFKEKGNSMLTSGRGILETFLRRGGEIVSWGKAGEAFAKLGEGVVTVENPEAVIAYLDGRQQRANRKIRAAVYTDKGGANYSILETLALSPEFEVKVLSAEDIAGGDLKDFDFLLQPGGGCNTQYQALGTNGVAEIERFVRNGGSYYGVCAGAFLATQTCEEKKPRIGMVPYRDQCAGVYRGWGAVPLKMTPEGLAVFGNSVTNREVIYWGGPVLLPGEEVPDSDVKTLATYNSYVFSSCSTNEIPSWYGCAAIVAGRVGKGKVFISCPHPEKSDLTYDMVLSGIRYLTGVRPAQVRRDRVPGTPIVLFKTAKEPKVAAFFVEKLIRDRRFDVTSNSEFSTGDLAHCDLVLVMSSKKEDFKNEKLKAFIERGGKVVALADTPEKREATAGHPNIVVVTDFDQIIPALETELGL